MKSGSYISRIGGQQHTGVLPLYTIATIVFLIFVAIIRGKTYALLGSAMVVATVGFVWRPWVFPALYLAYICLFPSRHGGDEQNFYPVHYIAQTSLIFLTGMAVVLQANRGVEFLRERGKDLYRQTRNFADPAGFFMTLLVGWFMIMILYGLSVGNDPKMILFEVSHVFVVFGYFVWRALFRRYGSIENWFFYFISISFITGLIFLFYIASNWQGIISFVVYRILSRQGNIILVAIPVIMSFLLISKSWKARVMWGFALFLSFIQMFMAQARSLWLAVFLLSSIYFSLYSFRNGFTWKGWRTFLSGLLLVLLLLTILLLAVMNIFDADMSILFRRWEDFGTLNDNSTMMRVFDVRHTYALVKQSPIFGYGMGAEMYSVPNAGYSLYIDNSFMHALYKGGFPYLIILMGVYLSGLYRSFQIYRQMDDPELSIFGTAFISTLLTLLFIGNVHTGLTVYRFGFLWMMVIAAAQVMYENWRLHKEGKLTEDV